MRVNKIITLPASRLRFRESEANPGPASSRLEYRICITATLGVSHLPTAGKKHLHYIYRLAGLVPVRASLERLGQQGEAVGLVRGVRHVAGDGNLVLLRRVRIRGGQRAAEIAGPQGCIANRVTDRKST